MGAQGSPGEHREAQESPGEPVTAHESPREPTRDQDSPEEHRKAEESTSKVQGSPGKAILDESAILDGYSDLQCHDGDLCP